jgi:hypothetical protein
MYLKPHIQGLDGIIPGGISIKDFSMVSKTDQTTARKILDELIKTGIGSKEGDLFIYLILIRGID